MKFLHSLLFVFTLGGVLVVRAWDHGDDSSVKWQPRPRAQYESRLELPQGTRGTSSSSGVSRETASSSVTSGDTEHAENVGKSLADPQPIGGVKTINSDSAGTQLSPMHPAPTNENVDVPQERTGDLTTGEERKSETEETLKTKGSESPKQKIETPSLKSESSAQKDPQELSTQSHGQQGGDRSKEGVQGPMGKPDQPETEVSLPQKPTVEGTGGAPGKNGLADPAPTSSEPAVPAEATPNPEQPALKQEKDVKEPGSGEDAGDNGSGRSDEEDDEEEEEDEEENGGNDNRQAVTVDGRTSFDKLRRRSALRNGETQNPSVRQSPESAAGGDNAQAPSQSATSVTQNTAQQGASQQQASGPKGNSEQVQTSMENLVHVKDSSSASLAATTGIVVLALFFIC
ncbi:BT1 domain containing protein, putative [Babesia ovata]|uniref:BT1 domain containing protein, putative n=1 Tax=Babesia ovata TaxID=189622 RepID=A0A2H6K7V7_9APIC|nr:BT1 domain containing protein, putative [Babesia ovata]GBE59083.1 BT1 domain containing protein, putative [Babesia ovata]